MCGKIALPILLILFPSPSTECGLDRDYSASFLSEHKSPTWTVGSSLNMQFNVSWMASSFHYYKFYLYRDADYYRYLRRWLLPYSGCVSGSHYSSCATEISSQEYQIDFSLTGLTPSENETYFYVKSCDRQRYNGSAFTILLGYCTDVTLPQSLSPVLKTSTSYSINQTLPVRCQHGKLFDENGYLVDYINATCSQHVSWNMPPHTCEVKGCPLSTLDSRVSLAKGQLIQDWYRPLTNVTVTCSEKWKMHYIVNPQNFIETSTTSCNDGAWTQLRVSCWKGQYVDFSATNKVTLFAGKPAIFSCGNMTDDDVIHYAMVIANSTVSGAPSSTWRNINITPEYHGEVVSCQQLDKTNGNTVLEQKDIVLDVIYSPVITSKDSTFTIKSGSRDFIVIPFSSNPVVKARDVAIFKEGKSVTNFHVATKDLQQSIILHFRQADDNVFGSYTLFLTYHSTVSKVVKFYFTVKKKKTTTAEQSTNIPTPAGTETGITLGSIAALTLLIVVTYKTYQAVHSKSSSAPDQRNSQGRHQENERPQNAQINEVPIPGHHYEDIEDKQNQTTTATSIQFHNAYESESAASRSDRRITDYEPVTISGPNQHYQVPRLAMPQDGEENPIYVPYKY